MRSKENEEDWLASGNESKDSQKGEEERYCPRRRVAQRYSMSDGDSDSENDEELGCCHLGPFFPISNPVRRLTCVRRRRKPSPEKTKDTEDNRADKENRVLLLKILGIVAILKERLDALESLHQSVHELVGHLNSLGIVIPMEEEEAEEEPVVPPGRLPDVQNGEMNLDSWRAAISNASYSRSSRWADEEEDSDAGV